MSQKTLIIGKIKDPHLQCGHVEMEIETCYRNASMVIGTILARELLLFTGKQVMIVIKELADGD